MKYSYEMSGKDSGAQTWKFTGTVTTKGAGEFLSVPGQALKQSFEALTQGKAVYGNPGIGCKGPYRVTKLVIELLEQ